MPFSVHFRSAGSKWLVTSKHRITWLVLLLKYFTHRGGPGYRSRCSDCLRTGRYEARNLVEARPSSSVSTMQRCPFLKENHAMMPPWWQVCVFVTNVLQLNWTVFVMHPMSLPVHSYGCQEHHDLSR